MKIFIEQTAKDYDLKYEIVARIYKSYWPDSFYDKLEEITQLAQVIRGQDDSKNK